MLRPLPLIWSRLICKPHLIAKAELDGIMVGLEQVMERRGSLTEALGALGAVEMPDYSMLQTAGPEPGTPPAEEQPSGYRIFRHVAVLPVHGVLASRIHSAGIDADSRRFQSYENLGRVIHAAHRDQRVRGILLDIDSPGGMADGVFKLADDIHRLRATKPIWAIANHSAMSAAYDLAAATERIYAAASTAALGSIGVVAVHRDQSAADAQEGIKYTFIHSGARKIDGTAHAPLTTEAHSAIKAEVEQIDADQIGRVATWRRLEPWTVRNMEAAIYHGNTAVDRHLADQVGSLEQAHAALVQYVTPTRGGTMDTAAEPRAEAPVDIDNVVQLRVDAARDAERERCTGIAALCNLHHVPDMIAALTADRSCTIELAGERIQERLRQDQARHPITPIDPNTQRQRLAGSEIEEAAKARFAAQRRGLYGDP